MKSRLICLLGVLFALNGELAIARTVVGAGKVQGFFESCKNDVYDYELVEQARRAADQDGRRKCGGLNRRISVYSDNISCKPAGETLRRRIFSSFANYQCMDIVIDAKEDEKFKECMERCMRRGNSEMQCIIHCGGW